ncbi:thioredoxin family protein [Bacteroidota bacterium]
MKKHFLIIATALVMVIGSCASNPKEKTQEDKTEATVAEAVLSNTESHSTIMLTKADFIAKVMDYENNPTEWVFEGEKPCLIDFYADWCAPCRITSPILEELAKEYKGKIDIYKIDTEKEQELAAIFGIQSIPSFLYVPMKGKPTMSSGIARTPEETKQMFRDQIAQILLQ